MPALLFDTLSADNVAWVTLFTSALANVSDADWTVACLVKRAHSGAFYEGMAYLYTAAANGRAGQSFQGSGPGTVQDSVYLDTGNGQNSPTALTNTTLPYLLILSKPAGNTAPRLARKLGSAGSWVHENMDAAQSDTGLTSDGLEIGCQHFSSEFFDGHIGVVAFWEGGMSDTDKEACGANWRTSDLWNNAHGQPKFLCQLNTSGSNLVDLAGGVQAVDRVVSGTLLDSFQTLDGWNFDGTGPAGPPPAVGPRRSAGFVGFG